MDKILETAKPFWPLLLLVAVYSAFTFYNLGNRTSPQTVWASEDTVFVDFGEVRTVSRFQYMTGARPYDTIVLFASIDGVYWHYTREIKPERVFYWHEESFNTEARHVQIVPRGPNIRIQEAAFRDQYDRLIEIYNIAEHGYGEPRGTALFDEQEMVPRVACFRNSFYFDEVYHARTGYEFLHGLWVLETTHPPMGKNLIAAGIAIFGMTPFGWRFAGTMAGIFMIPLVYMFGWLMFNKSHKWGLFAAFIFAFDFMTFAQTRIATIDSFTVLFIIASYLFMFAYVRSCGNSAYPLKRAMLFLAASGVFIGFSVATKWQGLYALAGLPLLFFPAWLVVFKRDKRNAFITFACCFAFFLAIPAVIYLLSYIPFYLIMNRGYGFFTTVFNNQRDMFLYHSQLLAGHPFSSNWWEWPVMIRPIFYYMNNVSPEIRQRIASFGNPAVWWFGIAATLSAIGAKSGDFVALFNKIRNLIRRGEVKTSGNIKSSAINGAASQLPLTADPVYFLLIAYAAQFIPWIFVDRATFIYHYFPSVPFVVLLIAYYFNTKQPKLIWAYGSLVFTLFLLFYPVLSGAPIFISYAETFLRWFPTWIF